LSVSSKVDFFVQNQWIVSTRISGLFRPESVDDLDQNTHVVEKFRFAGGVNDHCGCGLFLCF
ncbi:MAG: hypothetical protein KKC58_05415, partial [Gammaproteobacteria bacterium]|nr:hypothetical protein [Gammaproteobacteria bacterium]